MILLQLSFHLLEFLIKHLLLCLAFLKLFSESWDLFKALLGEFCILCLCSGQPCSEIFLPLEGLLVSVVQVIVDPFELFNALLEGVNAL